MLPGLEGFEVRGEIGKAGSGINGAKEMKRCHEGDIYKIVRGINRVEVQSLLAMAVTNVRGESFKVRRAKLKGGVQSNYFAQSLVGVWDVLSGQSWRQKQ